MYVLWKKPFERSLSRERFLWRYFFCFCPSDFTCRGFDSTMWKKDVISIHWKRRPNYKLHSDSERNSFSKNCVADFTVGCINDNLKLWKWKTCTDNRSDIYFVKKCGKQSVKWLKSKHFLTKVLTVWAWEFTNRHRSCEHYNEQVDSLFCTHWTFEWLDFEILESIVSVLPCDCF